MATFGKAQNKGDTLNLQDNRGDLQAYDLEAGQGAKPAGGPNDGAAGGGIVPEYIQKAAHPNICMWHLIFKILGVLAYFFGTMFMSYVNSFILIILCVAFDFWVVKNITGRKLVGLRWSNLVDENGNSEWKYECHTDETKTDPIDRNVFWYGTYLFFLIWVILFILNVLTLSLKNLIPICMALALQGSNLVGYWKCSKDQQKQASDLAKGGMLQMMTSNMG